MTKIRNLKHKIIVVLLIFVHIILAEPAQASGQPIYVVNNWQDYLRLVPLSVRNGYVPLLYTEHDSFTPEIMQFAEFYGGSLFALSTEDVDQSIAEQWPRSETIVVAQVQSRFGLVASSIAAALDVPLYFAFPSTDVLQQLLVRNVIVVGDVLVPVNVDIINLTELEEAQAYYNELVGERSVAVLAANDNMGFLAAEVVAYHRGNLLLAPGEIREYRPRYLAWVTRPEAVTKQSVQNLYALARFTDDSRVYDVGVGILTGFTPHDAALLIARAYAYPQFEGKWKARLVNAATDSISVSQSTYKHPFEIVTLGGKDLTSKALLQAMQSSGHVMVEAHGSPSGFALADGAWPGSSTRKITGLPPLIFVAESCHTGDIGGDGIKNSIALRIIAGGAVAYIGSMEIGGVGLVGEYPFAFSTPSMPLGELVRLQNAARMDVDADRPRGILIGEPTFHQFDQEFVSYEVFTGAGEVQVHIIGQGETTPVVLAFELSDDMSINYAQAYRSGNRDKSYVPGIVYFGSPLSVAPSFDHQVLLLEWPGGDGELTLQDWHLNAILRRVLSDSLIGVEMIFIDLLARPGTGSPLAVMSFLILVYVWRKRKFEANELWAGVLTGTGISFLGIIYCLVLRFLIPWSVIAMIGCGATTVMWIVSPRWREWGRIVLCVVVYIAPLTLLWLAAALIGASQRAQILVVWGLSLSSIAYGLAVLISVWIIQIFLGEESNMDVI